jgi:hypothetical protein
LNIFCDYWRELNIKKGKPKLPFFIRRSSLTTGIDLDQWFIVLLLHWFAFAWHADRRRDLRSSFLCGTQLGRIGGCQRQAGGAEHCLQVDRRRWGWRWSRSRSRSGNHWCWRWCCDYWFGNNWRCCHRCCFYRHWRCFDNRWRFRNRRWGRCGFYHWFGDGDWRGFFYLGRCGDGFG